MTAKKQRGPRVVSKLTQKELVSLIKKHGTVVIKLNDHKCPHGLTRYRKMTADGKSWYRTEGSDPYFTVKKYEPSCFWEDLAYERDGQNPSVTRLVAEMFTYDSWPNGPQRFPLAVYAKGKMILKINNNKEMV